jgi:SAM-dependent methyltransferase
MGNPPADYPGVPILEVMAHAENYNNYLMGLIIKHFPDSGPVLDFGAGTGTFALEARKRNMEILAVEIDAGLRRRLQSEGIETYASLDQVPLASVPYIYSFNVLEHIEDDQAAARALWHTLAPGGRLLIYVPAFNVLFTSLDRKVGHCRRYTRARLTRLLESVGFKVERACYADSLGFLATLLFKLFDNGKGDLNPRAVKLYDRLVFPLSRLLDTLVSAWFGKNVWVVARRE